MMYYDVNFHNPVRLELFDALKATNLMLTYVYM